MDLDKLDLLIRKINLAIKTIQKLRESELKYQEEIKILLLENTRLNEENENLKTELSKSEKLNQNNNTLQNELESKILEIIKFLPEDEDEDKIEENKNILGNKVNNSQEKSKIVETDSEEEILKNFVNEQKDKENTFSLFDNSAISKESTVNISRNNEEKENIQDLGFTINKKFEETFLDDNDKEVDFSFENTSIKSNVDLPKGVL